MKKLFLVLALCFSVAGCTGFNAALGVYKTATETTVPANVVVPTANAFDILKAGATNYGRYCIQQRMAPAICAASVRRVVIKAVRSGTGARNQLETSVANGQPAMSSIYNVLVAAVQGLQQSPAASTQFAGAAQ